MQVRPTKTKSRARRKAAPQTVDRYSWIGPRASADHIQAFGLRLSGGGAHQSKTMMMAELKALLSSSATSSRALRQVVIDDNVLAKSTANTRALTYRHLAALYGLVASLRSRGCSSLCGVRVRTLTLYLRSL